MIKFVFLDLDETIFDFKKAEKNALAKTFCQLGIGFDDDIARLYSECNISQWKRLEKGEITREQVKVNRYRLLFEKINCGCSPEKATAAYEKNLAEFAYLTDDAESFLINASKKFRLFAVTNGTKAVQESRIKISGIEKYFEDIFISEAAGYEKPSEKFFDFCFGKINGFDKSKSVIIGDSLSSDIKGGIDSGIKTVWLNRTGTVNDTCLKPDCEIKSLNELVL